MRRSGRGEQALPSPDAAFPPEPPEPPAVPQVQVKATPAKPREEPPMPKPDAEPGKKGLAEDKYDDDWKPKPVASRRNSQQTSPRRNAGSRSLEAPGHEVIESLKGFHELGLRV